MSIQIRAATDADRVFVLSSWIDSYRESPWAGAVAMADFHRVMWPQLERLLDAVDTTALIAADQHLLGFLVADLAVRPQLALYCYVKAAYRKMGIARMLFDAADINPRLPFDYAFKTEKVVQLAGKIPHASHQPMLARFPKGQGHRR